MLRRISRSPFVFWFGVCALAAVTGLVVSHALAEARAGAAVYGEPTSVLVAVRGVDPGTHVGDDDVEVRDLPASAVPAGALRSRGDLRGRALAVPLFPGEPVLEAHLGAQGRRGLAALLADGRQAVGVPVDGTAPKLRRGDVVEVLATVDDGPEPTFPVARAARVLDVRGDAVTVAVLPDEALRVAYAIARGSVAIALTANPSPGS